MFLEKKAGCGFPLLAGIALALIAILASGAHAQCHQPQYGVWRGLEVVIQPAPWLTIGFSTGRIDPPIYGGFQPYFVPPPPVFYGGSPQYYNGGYGGSPAYQQGYDAQMRRRDREAREAWEQAERAAGRRAADREWGIGPAYGRRRY